MQADFKVNVKAYWTKSGKLEIFESSDAINNNEIMEGDGDEEEDDDENSESDDEGTNLIKVII